MRSVDFSSRVSRVTALHLELDDIWSAIYHRRVWHTNGMPSAGRYLDPRVDPPIYQGVYSRRAFVGDALKRRFRRIAALAVGLAKKWKLHPTERAISALSVQWDW